MTTAAGDAYCWLKGWAYLLRTEKNADLIAEIEGGIKKEVSVGCSVRHSVCSICGGENGNVSRNNVKSSQQEILSYAIGKAIHMWIYDNASLTLEQKELLNSFILTKYGETNCCLK